MAEIEMILREPPPMIGFVRGEVVEGVLLSVRRMPLKGKLVPRYLIERENGTRVFFWGTYEINEVMKLGDLGHKISIVFIGEDATVGRGENKMKHFEVRISKEPVRAGIAPAKGDLLEITDDDIPF